MMVLDKHNKRLAMVYFMKLLKKGKDWQVKPWAALVALARDERINMFQQQ